MAIPKEPHGGVIKRTPAEDDRNFLTGGLEKLPTEKPGPSQSHRYRKRPGLVPAAELIRLPEQGIERERIHRRSLQAAYRVGAAASV